MTVTRNYDRAPKWWPSASDRIAGGSCSWPRRGQSYRSGGPLQVFARAAEMFANKNPGIAANLFVEVISASSQPIAC